MTKRIVLLPGDGVGPEVTRQVVRAINAAVRGMGLELEYEERAFGGAAIDAFGEPLPAKTLEACKRADAVFLGAVGGPKWDSVPPEIRAETGLLRIRSELGLFANMRPAKVSEALIASSPLRPEVVRGTDVLIVRELTGGIYFGKKKEAGPEDSEAYDQMSYTSYEIQRVARAAFNAARGRKKKLTSVDKANVLAVSRLWRREVNKVAEEFPDVELEHLYVDSAAMQIVTRPARFDVMVMGNLFGDILSDEASVLAGSIGMLPSASLDEGGFGLYEPVHGSAPDIAGQDKCNPIGAILSAAMLLRMSLGAPEAADSIERAVEAALNAGGRPADIAAPGEAHIGCAAMGDMIIERIEGWK